MSPNGSSPDGTNGFPVSPRILAILVMVAGVVGFVAARIVYGDQVLCLLGSTLITFLGLGILIASRRFNWVASARPRRERQSQSTKQSTLEKYTSHREPRQGRNILPRVQPVSLNPKPTLAPSQANMPEPLLDQVLRFIEANGAVADVETQHAGRAILHITGKDGQNYTALVREEPGQVDIAEVRGLFALVNSSGSTGGLFIAAGPFTQDAYAWAGARHIRLVSVDELDEISIG